MGRSAAVKMYTKRWCYYCVRARLLFERKGVHVAEVRCDSDPETRRWLREVTGRATLPQIFVDGRAIGGYDDLARLEAEGRLDVLLAPAP